MIIFPMTFIANTFVPSNGLPTLLRVFAEWNPISAVTLATRLQFGNVATGIPESTAWPMEHPVAYTLIWALAFLLVFAPLTVRQYHKIGTNR